MNVMSMTHDFEIHTVAVMMSGVLWHVALCPLMNGY